MRFLTTPHLFLWVFLGLAVLAGCEENPVTNPQLGPGDLLEATVDGEEYSFDLNTDLTNYEAGFIYGRIAGSTNTLSVKSIAVTFNYDIDNDPIPVTLDHPRGGITLVLTDDSGNELSYQTIREGEVSVRLEATDGEIIDGTFNGTLENTRDANDKVTITNGQFSAMLDRI